MFICLALGGKYSFWANLIQNVKTVCLGGKLVPRLF